MSSAARLQVDIVADAKGVGPGINDAESRFSKLGSTIGRVGKLAAVGLAVGLGAAAVAGFKLAQAAAADEAGAKRLEGTLVNVTNATKGQVAAVEDWITAQGRQLGVADDELRPAMQRLVTATGDVGKAQKLASIAMDVSAGTGKSLEAVTTALAKAQTGSVGGLSRLGVATKDAAGETLTFEQITKNLAATNAGQAAAAADTAAGKYGRLKLQLGEMGESIGAKLLPLGNKLAAWALEMAPKVSNLAERIGSKLSPILSAVGGVIQDRVIPAARGFATWFMDKIAPGIANTVTPIIGRAKSAFDNIRDAVERNREPLGKLGNALKTVAEFLADKVLPVVGKVITLAWEPMSKAIGLVIDAVGKLINFIDDAIGKMQDLIAWVKKIDIPKIDLRGWAGGAVGNLVTIGPDLAGRSPGYGRGRPFATAALGSGWAGTVMSAASSSTRPAMIDARTFLTVQVDGSGIVDEQRVADVLAPLLDRWAVRMGAAPVGGF